MAFTPTENGAELRMNYDMGGQEYHSILHIRNTGGWDLTSLEACRDDIQGYITGSDASVFNNQLTITGFTLTDVSVFGGSQVQNTITPLLVGTDIGNAASVNNTLSLKKQTAKTGRSYWGTVYHPGVGETRIDLDSVEPAYAASCALWWTQFKDLLSANGYGMCVRTTKVNGVPVNPYQLTFITAFVPVNLKVASLKRRLRRK